MKFSFSKYSQEKNWKLHQIYQRILIPIRLSNVGENEKFGERGGPEIRIIGRDKSWPL